MDGFFPLFSAVAKRRVSKEESVYGRQIVGLIMKISILCHYGSLIFCQIHFLSFFFSFFTVLFLFPPRFIIKK